MAPFDLTDFEPTVIEPLLPTKVCGVKRVDGRRVLNGISGDCGRERLGPDRRLGRGAETAIGTTMSGAASR